MTFLRVTKQKEPEAEAAAGGGKEEARRRKALGRRLQVPPVSTGPCCLTEDAVGNRKAGGNQSGKDAFSNTL